MAYCMYLSGIVMDANWACTSSPTNCPAVSNVVLLSPWRENSLFSCCLLYPVTVSLLSMDKFMVKRHKIEDNINDNKPTYGTSYNVLILKSTLKSQV